MSGILGAFNVGLSGLQAIGGGLKVISDNIANVGTSGFKASRPEFQDVLSNALKGSVEGGDQIGAGTSLAHVRQLFSQGAISRTESVTDLALHGDGFFVIDSPNGRAYSRDGSFHFDKDGYLVSSDGYKVLAFKANEDGALTTYLEPIRINQVTKPAKATRNLTLDMNIDSRAEVKQFDVDNPLETSNFSTGVLIYDNVGTPRLVNVYFNKVDNNLWDYHVLASNKDAAKPSSTGDYVEMAIGRLQFSNKGLLDKEIEIKTAYNFNKGAGPNQQIKFDFGNSISEGGDGYTASTQFGSNSSVRRHSQDGASATTLSSVFFNNDGVLTITYTNGSSAPLGQIAVAKFENNEGLYKMGKNLFKENYESGAAAVGKPRESGRGEILTKSLELSNVDLATEFTSLMTMQSNFKANAKTIATADELLQEILNIRR